MINPVQIFYPSSVELPGYFLVCLFILCLSKMNKEFVKYLHTCLEPQLVIWTWLFAHSDEHDCIIINLMELRLKFKHTPKIFTRVLSLDEFQGRQLITYEQLDKATIKIKFIRNTQVIKKQVLELSEGNSKALKTIKSKQLKAIRKEEKAEIQVINIGSGNNNELIVNTDQKQELTPIRKIEFSIELKNYLVDDYIEFFKSIQATRASMSGVMNPAILPPKIDGADISFFKKLSAYFRSLPRKTGNSEPLNDKEVRACFQKIYTSWETFDSFIQNGIKPQQMYFNINNIIIQMNAPQTDKIQKRENEYRQKIDQTGSRDYSHLLPNREKNH